MENKKKLPPIDLEELAERGIVTDLRAERARELLGSVPLILHAGIGYLRLRGSMATSPAAVPPWLEIRHAFRHATKKKKALRGQGKK